MEKERKLFRLRKELWDILDDFDHYGLCNEFDSFDDFHKTIEDVEYETNCQIAEIEGYSEEEKKGVEELYRRLLSLRAKCLAF